MFRYVLFLSFFFVSSLLLAQDRETFHGAKTAFRPLSIGDTVPDFRLYHLLNYQQKEVTLATFRGKAIIIDFWATFCQPCIAHFPELQSIQARYQQDLQIITVTNDSLNKVIKLFDNIRYQGLKLITVTNGGDQLNDSLFYAFAHQYIPHYIWIDKAGAVKAITGKESLTDGNVATLINGGDFLNASARKKDTMIREHPAMFAYQETGIAEKMMLNDSISGLLAYSMLTGYNRNYAPSSAIDCFGIYAERRMRLWNLPLSTMLRFAYGKISTDPREQELISMPRTFFNVRDPDILRKLTVNFEAPPDSTEDMYCYDLIIAGKGIRLLQERMKKDLYSYFGVKAVPVRKKVACYVLEIKDSMLIKTKGGDAAKDGNIYYLKLKNMPFSKLVDHIRSYNEGSKSGFYRGIESGIIEDHTGFSSPIDISISARMNDIPALKVALEKYGINLRESEQMVETYLFEN
ncbi:TlpA family protein disulfide reductase [Chitinophaga agri]|uniref:Redoxin domain-containing protein n=1 Tax=Chitinophaga agri TaxID=2703787 RepID=A0A6B9ZPE8_9BACT|nr:TlpA family protein disulfide reductase [Chitinophaga agri]QHS63025.1 redoxin domain-containing protein [Chitinophaga agri]